MFGVSKAFPLACLLVACGSSTPQPADSASGAGAHSSFAEPTRWQDMSREQRMEFMGVAVTPKLKQLFQAFDPKGFREFGCKTCHGPDMEAVDYRMPNGLMALPQPDPLPGASEYDPEVTKFMLEQVVPSMRELLQQGETELTCFACHAAEP